MSIENIDYQIIKVTPKNTTEIKPNSYFRHVCVCIGFSFALACCENGFYFK